MSYILEALKKLEQKREREGLPTLFTLQGDSPEKRKRRPPWVYLILAALLLNAGMTLWWIAPWRSGQQMTQPQLAAPAQNGTRSAPVASPPGAQPAAQETASPPSPAAKREVAPPAVPTPQPSATEKKTAALPAQKTVAAPAAGSPSADSKAQPGKPPAPSGKVVSLQELPATVRSSLPELKVSMHYYSDEPRSRLVRINDMTLREGDVLNPPGLKVEEITPTHILFSYQGYRFTVSMDGR